MTRREKIMYLVSLRDGPLWLLRSCREVSRELQRCRREGNSDATFWQKQMLVERVRQSREQIKHVMGEP